MAANTAAADAGVDREMDKSGIGGQPAGLTTLFFTEMWERFSYYGMRGLLLLFMKTPVADGGFSIFYMGINLGAFLAPIVCGFLAQSAWFKGQLGRMGFHPEGSWHWGFAMAGIGMTFGLIQYLAARRRLSHVGNRPRKYQ